MAPDTIAVSFESYLSGLILMFDKSKILFAECGNAGDAKVSGEITMKMSKLNHPLIGLFTIIVSVLVLFNCSKDKNVLGYQSTGYFEIYFSADSDLEYSVAVNIPLHNIIISNTPVATENDIVYYKIFTYSKSPALAHTKPSV